MKFSKREIPKGNGEGGMFLRLADGESVQGVFAGEVFEFWQKWPQGGQKEIFDVPTAGASSRFKANFIVKEGDKFIPKIFEFGLTVYNQLAEINEEYALDETKVKISRRGTGKDTAWVIMPLLKEPLAPATIKQLRAVKLNMLGHAQPPAEAPADDSSEAPF